MNKTSLQVQTFEVLSDKSKSGRVRPWRQKKMQNELLALAYDHVDPAKATRLRDCATWLYYEANPSGRKVLKNANFCRVRLCPVCIWRRSMKVHGQVSKVLNFVSNRNFRYIFLTLTVQNCKGEEFSGTVDAMMKAWHRLIGYKSVSLAVRGWYRSMEITHDVNPLSPGYDMFHPHFHVLIAVDQGYFKNKTYISQAKWTALWKKAMRVDYTPIVDVRRVKSDSPEVVAEIAKYAVKEEDYLVPEDWNFTIGTVRLLDKVLNNRRFLAFGGALKDAHRLLELDDVEDGDLTHVDDEGPSEASQGPSGAFYVWQSGYRQYLGAAF